MPETTPFVVGVRVRHEDRPEWGIGRIKRIENIRVAGNPAQRLTVQFPNAGTKTLSSVGARLSVVEVAPGADVDEGGTLIEKEAAHETGWLGEISNSNPEDAMAQLPLEATDPFRPAAARLKTTLGLYRFSDQGTSLMDWAVARSGLDDPLSRFTRHELEKFFERWSRARDQHLDKLMNENRLNSSELKKLLDEAPPAARRALGRTHANGKR
ncbi:MAG: DUF3553 domain-containing protein [Phycisphaerales bacterium]